MSHEGAFENSMQSEVRQSEVTSFLLALRAAVPERPDPAIAATLVSRLAATARTHQPDASTNGSTASTATAPTRRFARRPRLALAAKAAVALGALVISLAGLAVAGVKLPAPARAVFEGIGVNLPNQVNDPATRGKSAAAHRRVLERRAQKDATKRGKALGHTRGKAIGLRGLTPPGQELTPAGPPTQSNAGGSATGQSQSSSHRRRGKKHN